MNTIKKIGFIMLMAGWSMMVFGVTCLILSMI